MHHDLLSDDVSTINTGDPRLNRRCAGILSAFMERPGLSIPETMVTGAATEACYRALRNSRVTADLLIGPHRSGTWRRAMAAYKGAGSSQPGTPSIDKAGESSTGAFPLLINLHDTTQMRYGGESIRMGLPHDGSKSTLYIHLSCVVGEGDIGELFGVSHHDIYVVDEKCWIPLDTDDCAWEEELLTGSERWQRSIQSVAAACPKDHRMAHVMDREADDYALWCVVLDVGHELVVRGCHARKTKPEGPAAPAVSDLRADLDTVATRSVHLSRRGGRRPPASRTAHPDREERAAKLSIRVGAATFVRPANYPPSCREEIALQVVHVIEIDPPAGHEPVDWLLYTTLPVATAEDALRVVDIYRRRWVIEEYFKALKTGCGAEALQLESAKTLRKMIAVLVPAAWKLMALRTLSRDDRATPAGVVMDEVELAVLRNHPVGKALSQQPTVAEVCRAVAQLGGHLKQNGRPGWAVLHRGLQVLLGLTAGWRLAFKSLEEGAILKNNGGAG